jgi:hypothetical protein
MFWMCLVGHAVGGQATIYDTGNREADPAVAPLAWIVKWDGTVNPGLSFEITDPASGAKTRTMLVTLTYTFTAANPGPIVLTLTQAGAGVAAASYGGRATPNDDALGLNFVLKEVLNNQTGKPITGFTETLTDSDMTLASDGKTLVPLTPTEEKAFYRAYGTGAHPAFSHFHPVGPYDPFDVKNPKAFDGRESITLTGATLANNNAKPTNINLRIHDIVVEDYKRQFTLTITSATNPEPASVISLLIGMVSIAGYGLMRKELGRRDG